VKVLLTGSHGLIGSCVARVLEARGDQVVRLVRTGSSTHPGGGEAAWDPLLGSVDPAALVGAHAVVHLAGAGVAAHRWTPQYKEQILDSRVRGTRTIAEALAGAGSRAVLVSGSAIGYYGIARGADLLDESEPAGPDFLGQVCGAWEAATAPAVEAGCRVVLLRSGLVLSAAGGILAKQLPVFRAGLGGSLGSGRQYQSWITRQDEVRAILHAVDTASLNGPVNACSPQPVTQAVFARALARALRRPALARVPAGVLHAALGREMADETVLAGQRVLPRRLVESGFAFEAADLEAGLTAALSDKG
jgi:uncharacterized protein (TIGR01777 family)